MRDTLVRTFWHAGAGALLLTAPAPGESPAGDAAPGAFVVEERLDVEVVELQVRVTDRRGRPVAGLSRDDFRLSVDGREVEITHFVEVREGEPVPGVEAAPAAGPPEPEAPPAEEPPHLIVFLDTVHIEPGHLGGTLRAVEALLLKDPPLAGPVTVVANHRSLELTCHLCREPEEVRAALATLRHPPTAAVERRAELRGLLDDLQTMLHMWEEIGRRPTGVGGGRDDGLQRPGGRPGPDSLPGDVCAWGAPLMLDRIRGSAAAAENRGRQTLERLGALLGWMEALPGRKALLYVSGGLPVSPGLELYHWFQDACPDEAGALGGDFAHLRHDPARRFRDIAALAAAAGVVIFSLEPGIEAGEAAASVVVADRRIAFGPVHRQIGHANRQSWLFNLAAETGGQAFLNVTDPGEVVGDFTAALGAYYSLGFRPDHPPEGALHQVGVRLAPRGLRAHHAPAFRHRTLAERLAQRTLAASLLGEEVNPHGIEVAVGPPVRRPDGRLGAPVVIRLPAGFLEVEGVPAREPAELLLVVAVLDPGRGAPEVRRQEVFLPGVEAGDENTIVVDVPLAADELVLAVSLFAADTGRLAHVPLRVGAVEAAPGDP